MHPSNPLTATPRRFNPFSPQTAIKEIRRPRPPLSRTKNVQNRAPRAKRKRPRRSFFLSPSFPAVKLINFRRANCCRRLSDRPYLIPCQSCRNTLKGMELFVFKFIQLFEDTHYSFAGCGTIADFIPAPTPTMHPVAFCKAVNCAALWCTTRLLLSGI